MTLEISFIVPLVIALLSLIPFSAAFRGASSSSLLQDLPSSSCILPSPCRCIATTTEEIPDYVYLAKPKLVTPMTKADCSALNLTTSTLPTPQLHLGGNLAIDLSSNHLDNHLPDHYFEPLNLYHNATWLSSLIELNLANNLLTRVPKAVGRELGSLKTLSLQRNRIDVVTAEHLSNLTLLRVLCLSDNLLTTIEQGTFDKLKLLASLDLARNKISQIEGHIGTSRLLDLSDNRLEQFDCSVGESKFMHTYIYMGMRSIILDGNEIKDLWLSHGVIVYWGPGEVSLRRTNIGMLTADYFKGNNFYLKTLNLAQNRVTSIENDTFCPVKHVQKLSLAENNLSALSSEIFTCLVFLTSLNLSFNGLSEISSWNSEILTYLEELYLDNNSFGSLNEMKLQSAQLQLLSAANNKIGSLKADDLRVGYSTLRTLNLDYNEIIAIEGRAFCSVPVLKKLQLAGNLLRSVHKDSFACLTSLTALNLSSNLITEIYSESFHDLQSLVNLTMNDNLMTYIPDGLFANLPLLKRLRFHNNLILSLSDGVFQNLASLTDLAFDANVIGSLRLESFAGLRSLEMLNILYIRVRLPPLFFQTFPNLTFLSLAGSSLDRLPDLRWLPKLKMLDIRATNISTIYECQLFGHHNLHYLLWDDSPVNCDCSLRWLREFLGDRLISTLVYPIKCQSPPALSGKYLADIDETEFVCARGQLPVWCNPEGRDLSRMTSPVEQNDGFFASCFDIKFSMRESDAKVSCDVTLDLEWHLICDDDGSYDYLEITYEPLDEQLTAEETPSLTQARAARYLMLLPETTNANLEHLFPEKTYKVCITYISYVNALEEKVNGSINEEEEQEKVDEQKKDELMELENQNFERKVGTCLNITTSKEDSSVRADTINCSQAILDAQLEEIENTLAKMRAGLAVVLAILVILLASSVCGIVWLVLTNSEAIRQRVAFGRAAQWFGRVKCRLQTIVKR